MAKYWVQVPITVVSTDYIAITVEANSKTEARNVALNKYLHNEYKCTNIYSGEDFNATVDSDNIDIWNVEEIIDGFDS